MSLVASTLPVVVGPTAAETAPAASEALLAGAYRLLQPENIRTTDGPPEAIARGSAVGLRFDLRNESAAPLTVPRTTYRDTTGWWIGSIRLWIAPMTTASTGDARACLARTAVPVGDRFLVSSRPFDMGWADRVEFPAFAGSSHDLPLPAAVTRCLPLGRYRIWIDHARLDASETDGSFGFTTFRIALVQAVRWTAPLALPTPSGYLQEAGTVTVSIPRDAGTLTAKISLQGATPATRYTIGLVAGGCDGSTAVPLSDPIALTTASDGSYVRGRTRTISVTGGERLRTSGQLAVTLALGGSTICMPAEASPLPPPAKRAPALWSGGQVSEWGTMPLRTSAIVPGSMAPKAVDGNPETIWSSGMPTPGWIELDLIRTRPVTGVWLLPAQTSSPARTVHRIYGRGYGSTEHLLASVSRTTADHVWFRVTFSRAATVRYIRIETVTFPSPVAWAEIGLIGPGLAGRSLLPEGALDGWAEGEATGEQCSAFGWANDPDDRTRRVAVRLLVDGRTVWEGTADQERPDLRIDRLGDGWSGFSVDLRPLLTLAASHIVTAEAKDLTSDRWVALPPGGRKMLCR